MRNSSFSSQAKGGGRPIHTHRTWNASVAIVGIIAVAAIVVTAIRAGIDGALVMSGLAVIGGAIGYAVKNLPISKEGTR